MFESSAAQALFVQDPSFAVAVDGLSVVSSAISTDLWNITRVNATMTGPGASWTRRNVKGTARSPISD
jgi:hypothetical protein